MKKLLKTMLFLLLTSSILSCELSIKKEEMIPSKTPDVTLDSLDGDDKPIKP